MAASGMSLAILGNQGPYPGRDGACSGYLLRCGASLVCLELGPGTLARLQRYVDVTSLDALVISHYHADHFSDVMTLRYALRRAEQAGALARPLRLVLPAAGMHEFVSTYIGEGYCDLFSVTAVEHGSALRVGGIDIEFRRMRHGVESFGMTLRVQGSQPDIDGPPGAGRAALGYTSDTGPCEALESLSAASKVLLAECAIAETPAEAGAFGHLWPEYAGALARDAGVDRLILTHFAPGADQVALVRAASEVHGATAWGAVIGETYDL